VNPVRGVEGIGLKPENNPEKSIRQREKEAEATDIR
jgi:hypothetical protein